jgi:hypothetical protein
MGLPGAENLSVLPAARLGAVLQQSVANRSSTSLSGAAGGNRRKSVKSLGRLLDRGCRRLRNVGW